MSSSSERLDKIISSSLSSDAERSRFSSFSSSIIHHRVSPVDSLRLFISKNHGVSDILELD
ncbi:hypothetical protein LguiB_012650 [Lonicera macranthoides]